MKFNAAEVLGTSEGLNPKWEKVRTSLFTTLLDEHPHADTLDLILLERVSYLYARLRQKESLGAYGNERSYKSAVTLLATFMAEIRKSDNRAQLLELIRADAVDAVVGALQKASEDLDDLQRQTLMANVIHLVKDADAEAS